MYRCIKILYNNDLPASAEEVRISTALCSKGKWLSQTIASEQCGFRGSK